MKILMKENLQTLTTLLLATTQIYLDSFENSQIDAAMANLL